MGWLFALPLLIIIIRGSRSHVNFRACRIPEYYMTYYRTLTDNQLKDTYYDYHYHKIFNTTKKPYYEPRFYIYMRGTLYIESKNFYRLL